MTGTRTSRSNDATETRVLAAASRLYAEEGFEVPLARIARAARVSTAELRRVAADAESLRDRVIERNFTGRWNPQWEALLVNRRIAFGERLTRFFVEYRENIERTGARLWTRAGLLGWQARGNFSDTLATRILEPIARELRREAGVRGAARRAVSGRERELVQVLHGAVAFPHTREFIFGMRVEGRLPDLIAMMVRVWLPGAKTEMRRLHARSAAARR